MSESIRVTVASPAVCRRLASHERSTLSIVRLATIYKFEVTLFRIFKSEASFTCSTPPKMSGRFARHDLFERSAHSPAGSALDLRSLHDNDDVSSHPPLSGRSLGASSVASRLSRTSIGVPAALVQPSLRQILALNANAPRFRNGASVRRSFVHGAAESGLPPNAARKLSTSSLPGGTDPMSALVVTSETWKLRRGDGGADEGGTRSAGTTLPVCVFRPHSATYLRDDMNNVFSGVS